MKSNEARYINQLFQGHIYHARSSSHSKAVVTGLAKHLRWVLSHTIIDIEGRFIILKGTFNFTEVLIVAAYAPHIPQTGFGDKIFVLLRSSQCFDILIRRDFNEVFDGSMDRSLKTTLAEIPKNLLSYKIF